MRTLLLLLAMLAVFAATTGIAAEEPAAPAAAAADEAAPFEGAVAVAVGCKAINDNCGAACDPIECTGDVRCLAEANYVECDGVRTYCPPSCCDASATCRGSKPIFCSGVDFCLPQDRCSVTCDGVTTWCPDPNFGQYPDEPICLM